MFRRIAELFYPKELKEIIRELEAENNLRHEPLERLNKFIVYVCYGTISSLTLLVFIGDGFIPSAIIFSILLLLFSYLVRFYSKYFIAYKIGDIHEVVIIKIIRNEFIRVFPNSNIICERLSDQKRFIIPRIINSDISKLNLHIGDKIKVYASEKSWKHAVADIHEFKLTYCLQRDLIDNEAVYT